MTTQVTKWKSGEIWRLLQRKWINGGTHANYRGQTERISIEKMEDKKKSLRVSVDKERREEGCVVQEEDGFKFCNFLGFN